MVSRGRAVVRGLGVGGGRYASPRRLMLMLMLMQDLLYSKLEPFFRPVIAAKCYALRLYKGQ